MAQGEQENEISHVNSRESSLDRQSRQSSPERDVHAQISNLASEVKIP